MTADPAPQPPSRRAPPVRRALTAILLFQLGLAGLLVFGDVGRDFAWPSRAPASPDFTMPARPGDQTRRYDPSDMPVTRPAQDGPDTRPSGPMPNRLTLEEADGDLTLTGMIAPGDADRIGKLIATRLEGRTGALPRVVLNSPGGSVSDALALGRALRDTGLATIVGATDICLSACPYILAAGTERTVADGGRVGVHQHYFGENTLLPAFTAVSDIQHGQAAVMRYLDEMGVDPMVMVPALSTPPNRIYLMMPDELARYRLVTDAPDTN